MDSKSIIERVIIDVVYSWRSLVNSFTDVSFIMEVYEKMQEIFLLKYRKLPLGQIGRKWRRRIRSINTSEHSKTALAVTMVTPGVATSTRTEILRITT